MVMLDLVVAILKEGVLGFVSLSRAQVLAEGTTLAQRYYRLSSVVGRSVMGFTLGLTHSACQRNEATDHRTRGPGRYEATGIESSASEARSYEFT